MSRIEILKNSLEKKEQKLAAALDAHWNDVKSANGQPLNDKRNGASTMSRWEKQNRAIGTVNKSIELTKNAIDKIESEAKGLAHIRSLLPVFIVEMMDAGEIIQWKKHPNIFFVPDVEKARIVYDIKKKRLSHSYAYTVTDPDLRKRFANTYNKIFNLHKTT